MDFQALSQKKVLGVPMLYVAAAFVTILAVVAWKMSQSSPEGEVPVEAETGDVDEDADVPGAVVPFNGKNYHQATDSGGTVVTVPTEPAPPAPVPVDTNETWARKATNWLVSTNKAPGGEAQTAIVKYLDGGSLSYREGQLRDLAVKEYGIPPEGIGTPGKVADAPAQRQFDPAKGSGHHTVKNSNDDTAGKLASLYYGSSTTESVKAITGANPTKGAGPYSPGAVLLVPDLTPVKYFTTTKIMTQVQIGAANSIPASRVAKFNPKLPPVVPAGTKVRVA